LVARSNTYPVSSPALSSHANPTCVAATDVVLKFVGAAGAVGVPGGVVISKLNPFDTTPPTVTVTTLLPSVAALAMVIVVKAFVTFV
jgi:hypothetical protein